MADAAAAAPPKVYVVTGCSSGIGLELAKQLTARGDKVYATCRKKESSLTGEDKISAVEGVTIIEGIDVAKDDVGTALQAALKDVTVHCVIHNAGSLNGTRAVGKDQLFPEQNMMTVSMDRMRAAFEVNTLGPLRVQQALQPQMQSPGGKIVIISTGMGSIGDNGSGGKYAYRVSKAGVNMVAKSMAADLKDKQIGVQAVAPGHVVTEFGPGSQTMAQWGGCPVDKSVQGILKVVDAMSADNSGKFMMVPTKDPLNPKEFPW